MRRVPGWFPAMLLLCGLCRTGLSAPVENGNTLALDFVTAGEALRKELERDAIDHLFFFRYLRIREIEKSETNGLRSVRMSTVEPSSDMRVDFTVSKRVSLEIAQDLEKEDAVAVTGRVKSISAKENRIVLEPVIVRYKDRESPKAGRELLHEVDPRARKGTDTSSGKEQVIR